MWTGCASRLPPEAEGGRPGEFPPLPSCLRASDSQTCGQLLSAEPCPPLPAPPLRRAVSHVRGALLRFRIVPVQTASLCVSLAFAERQQDPSGGRGDSGWRSCDRHPAVTVETEKHIICGAGVRPHQGPTRARVGSCPTLRWPGRVSATLGLLPAAVPRRRHALGERAGAGEPRGCSLADHGKTQGVLHLPATSPLLWMPEVRVPGPLLSARWRRGESRDLP